MIADGDSVAKNAFRVALLSAEDTPLPVNRTQELDPNDILEVRDMAEAIARAEQIVSAPRSSRPAPPSSRRGVGETDLFESLGRRPTDDTAGPATPAPRAVVASALHLLRPEATIRATIATPAPAPPTPVHELVLSLPSTEEDAYFAPAGRIRSLADQTLDGYRPEPTLLLRARARRSSFTWILGAALLPLLVLAAIAFFGRQDAASAPTPISTTTIATATLTTTAAPKPVPVAAQTKEPAAVVTSTKPAATSPGVPVFDVNSLPTAKAAQTR